MNRIVYGNMTSKTPTRKAILIGCPGKGADFLGGVKKDIENISSYLQAEQGGAWNESEITKLLYPSAKKVRETISNAVADYVFVYFSGHGYTDATTRKRMIRLQEHNLADSDLLNKSQKQLVLIDACRQWVGPGISGVPEYGPTWEYFDGSPARRIFDDWIAKSSAGKVIVHSTADGGLAYDSGTGGMFTNALIHAATAIKSHSDYAGITIGTLLKNVSNNLVKRGNCQQPEITYYAGHLTVPFALTVPYAVPDRPKNFGIQKQTAAAPSISSKEGWAALVLSVLFIAVLASVKGK
jgi:hypothetical protein